MPKTWYFSARTAQRDFIKKIQLKIIQNGNKIAYDWTKDSNYIPKDYTNNGETSIQKADGLQKQLKKQMCLS